ncbi:MAG: Hsp20/alpha crystallin family protein [Prevotella sp.]|nr:Hsp20/alpha crystallin family protein [Prevotella sp.]
MLPVMFKNSWFPTVFDEFLNSDFTSHTNTTTAPAVNVKEDEKEYTMEVAAPGIKKEFCRVSLNEEGNLCIAIENKMEHKEEDKKQHYLRREFSYTNYQQNYSLPEDVVKDKISARVENGILTVTLPKQEKEAKVSKSIEIS